MRVISYNTPAKDWNEAIPIGNGRMGAMVFGQSGRDRLQLNEDSIWYGGPQNRINKDCKPNLPKIRQLLLDGKINEAENLMTVAMSATPQSERPYQTAGNLWFNFPWGEMTDYKRELNLSEGKVTVSYTQNGANIVREYFASQPAQLIVVKVKTDKPGSLSFSLMMDRGRFYDGACKMDDNTIKMWGNTGENAVRFLLATRAVAKGGNVSVIGEHLTIENADEVTLYVSMETSFYHPEMKYKLEDVVKERLENATQKGYEEILDEHTRDYKALYDRVDINLEGADPHVKYSEDYFQFVRYLMISGSRKGTLPLNLQGIWNDSMTPAWDSKYTININTEMNYWPVEGMQLSECHMPLFSLLKRLRCNGHQVAKEMYGCRGFVAHHNTDIWADCAPQDIYIPATYWVMGGAWLCTHIWKHYLYTGDKEFLRDMYDTLQDAVLFFHDFLIEVDGQLLTCPSVSPENTYILPDGTHGHVCYGATMDTEILIDLFSQYIKASNELGISSEEVEKTKEIAARLPKLQIGKYGQILEWNKDYDEAEPGHRHISHLYALHPSDQITPDETEEFAKAAKNTLARRLQYGGGHTGWSCAWIVNMYARLFDGENAWENLVKLFEHSTCPNMFSNHPMGLGYVFQIDGNFGGASGMIEMLIQSNENRTLLLPAVPKAWEKGSVKGLAMCHGALVDMAWENGKVIKGSITATRDMATTICYNGKKVEISLNKGQRYCL